MEKAPGAGLPTATPQTAKLADMLALLKESEEVPTPYAPAPSLGTFPQSTTDAASSSSTSAVAFGGVAAIGNNFHLPIQPAKPALVVGEEAHDVCNCRKSRCLKLYVGLCPVGTSNNHIPYTSQFPPFFPSLYPDIVNVSQRVFLAPRLAIVILVQITGHTTNSARKR